MLVTAHGSVDAYCSERGMVIGERYEGKLEDYAGGCVVVVTDNCDSLNDYYYMKYKLRRRGIELVSTHWSNEDVALFVEHLEQREAAERKKIYRGRLPFGFEWVQGEVVENPVAMDAVRRIFELRDRGASYRLIVDDDEVRYPDGRKMSISTIQVILRNREKYGGA